MAKNEMDKYAQQFHAHLNHVDGFILVVLKCHLIMEGAIDNILRLIFFHPDIILDSRMNFFQKVEIVRAYALREDEMSVWKLMHAIAELRNEVAHNLEPKKRDARIARVRSIYYSEISPQMVEDQKSNPDEIIVMAASSLCTGFLGAYEEDIAFLREKIDHVAKENGLLNPDGTIKKKPKLGGPIMGD